MKLSTAEEFASAKHESRYCPECNRGVCDDCEDHSRHPRKEPRRLSMKPVWRCPRCGSWVDASSTGNLVAHSMEHYNLTKFMGILDEHGPLCPDCGLPMSKHTEEFRMLMRRRGEA